MAVRPVLVIAVLANIVIVVLCTGRVSSNAEATSPTHESSTQSYTSATSSSTSTHHEKCRKEKKCSINEEYSHCIQSTCRAQNCTEKGEYVKCPRVPKNACKKGCVCKENYLRAENGTCIPEDQCPLKCDDSEVVDNCPADCSSDYCPICEDDNARCSKPDPCPPPACKCRFNYRRADNGTCIPTRNCPPFDCSARPNEEYNPCPPLCPTDDCSQASPSGTCPSRFGRIGIILPCNPKCRCIKGYWRKDGICVPYGECPGVCPSHERYSTCIQGECRALNCTQKDESIPCPRVRPESCLSGCVCEEGYLRAANGTCVPEDQCPIKCDDNEVVDNCPADCNSDYCPTSEGDNSACSTPDPCPPPACKCRFNYRRADNGTCIPTRNCPPFDCSARPNEEYNPCPPLCPTDDCSQASPSGTCPSRFGRIGIILPCNPKCRCIKGYWRRDGICVPYGECPGVCPSHERYSTCIQGECRALNCTQKDESIPCPRVRPESCLSGCVCEEGYLRAANGTCVPEDQCPIKCDDNEVVDNCPADCNSDYCPTSEGDNSACSTPDPCPPPACKCRFNYRRADNGTCIPTRNCPPFDCSARPNEEYNPCPPLCPTDDCSQASPSGTCPSRFGRIGIILPCNPKCRCIKGYWRRDGICVPYGECPGVCPSHERYSTCIQGECRALNCTQKDESIPCPRVRPESCLSGCVCEEGYLRAANGTCVLEDQCPIKCDDNEVVDNCPADCNSDYCPTSEGDNAACSTPDPCPPPACKCRFNYRRADNGTCIPTRNCPPFDCSARPNEEYNPCPPLCPTDDCSQASPSGTCPSRFGRIGIILPCNPKCRCIKGYWRRDGICVPYGECPGVCPSHERYSTCIQGECRALNCTQKDESIPCPRVRPESCLSGCVCEEGYLRAANGTCVLEDQCPIKCDDNEVVDNCPADCNSDYCPISEGDNSACSTPDPCPPPACKCRFNYRRADNGTCIPTRNCPPFDCSARPNEEYNPCPPLCPTDDCSQASPSGTCPSRFGRIGIILPCNPKCRCIKGYWRRDGICVPYGECPGVCPSHERYSTCIQGECRALNCTQKDESIPCLRVRPESCLSGCVCEEGYLRAVDGTCVPEDQCETRSCPGVNEVYTDSKVSCPPNTCMSLVARYKCDENQPVESGCICASGYLRLNNTEPCIPICDCPEMANSPECL